MNVSIIIVNYNTKDLLAQCIRSIVEKTFGIEYEIIVVDNDSHDGSVQMLRDEFPKVKIIEAGENLGFGKANNLGMMQAKGKYLFLLNSDTILINNAIKDFYDQAEQLRRNGHKIGALGSILFAPDMTTCHSFGKFITPKTELKTAIARYLRFLKDPSNIRPEIVDELKSVDYITGADLFIPRNVFEETEGFDQDYFMYCEEVDWQKRMSEAGYERLIIPGPEIIHLEGGSDSTSKISWSKNRVDNIQKSRNIYYSKHFRNNILPVFKAALWIVNVPWKLLMSIKNN